MLSDEEKKILGDFISRVDAMKSTNLISYLTEQKRIFTNFSWSEAKGTKIESNAPTKETLALFLMYFRQIYSVGERINVNRVCNILYKSQLLSTKALKNINQFRKFFNILLKEPVNFKIIIGKNPVAETNKDVLDLFINGEFFHYDSEYADILSRVKLLEVYPFLWQIFLGSLTGLSNITFGIRNNMIEIEPNII